jgi:hypothetical protein
MSNNPFMPPKFVDQSQKGKWSTFTGPWEDGPGAHTNPANSTTVVYYNGQDQTSLLNVSYTKLPRHVYPGAAPPSMSKLQ